MAKKATPTLDNFQNFQAALGLGADNQISNSTYGFNPITRLRQQLEWMYRGSWLVGAAVDAPADDMCRAGIEFETTLEPDKVDALQAAIQDFGIWRSLAQVIKWSRLYGGALGYIMIDGQDPESPLRLDTIGEGQFLGLMPLDRWMVQPTMAQLISDLGPEYGLPKYYDLVQTLPTQDYWPRIHHSRLIRMVGIELPWNQAITENMWGESVVERIYDRLVSYDSTSAGAAQLVYKAHLRIMKVAGLRNIIAAGGAPMAGLTSQISMMRSTQSSEGITLVDAQDEFETQAYTFAGLSDIMLSFGEQISGALQIPLIRLFGQSPGGLNASGDSDLRTYYDHTAKEQEAKLRKPWVKLLDIMSRSTLGEPLPPGFRFKFNPLWLVTEKERADIATQTTDSVIKAFESSIISQATALKEMRKASHFTGLFTNITDEDIEDADDKPPQADGSVDPAKEFLKPEEL